MNCPQRSEQEISPELPMMGPAFKESKKVPRIGNDYQAEIPEVNSECSSSCYYKEDCLLWNPNRMLEADLLEYLSKVKRSASTLSGHSTEEEDLYLLLQCEYKAEEALRRKQLNPMINVDTMSLWPEKECSKFETGIKVHKKNFHLIQKRFCKSRSVEELVNFYYLWKKTSRGTLLSSKYKKRNFNSPKVLDVKDVDKENAPDCHSSTQYFESKWCRGSFCDNLSLPSCSLLNFIHSSRTEKPAVFNANNEACVIVDNRPVQRQASENLCPQQDMSITSEKSTGSANHKDNCKVNFQVNNLPTKTTLKSVYNTRFKAKNSGNTTARVEMLENQSVENI